MRSSQQGQFAEALAEFERGHELGSQTPELALSAPPQWVRETERLVELDRKLPAILAGEAKPSMPSNRSPSPSSAMRRNSTERRRGFWAEAFQAQPKLAEDMKVQNRYNAACAAALAGSGQGKDDPPLDDATKARWRKQAIDWLKADLAAWSKILASGPPQVRQAITQTLQHWKADTDLAGLRDAAALAKLPDDEQKACRALWAEVDALLAKAKGTKSKVTGRVSRSCPVTRLEQVRMGARSRRGKGPRRPPSRSSPNPAGYDSRGIPSSRRPGVVPMAGFEMMTEAKGLDDNPE